MATVLDTFITRFGFETDTKGLKKAEKGLDDLKSSAFKIAAVAGSILGGGFFLTGVAQAAVDTAKFADALGLTVEEMSTLEFVAQKVNVPIETLKGQAFNLAQALNEAAQTGAGISDDLTRFGLSATDAAGKTKTLTAFIDDVRVKMQGLDAIEQADLADKLFFDEETIALLKATPELIAEITKEAKALGILTRQDAAKAKEFQDGLINLRLGFKNIQTTLGNLAFDKLSSMFEIINKGLKFFEKNEKQIVKALKVIGKAFLTMGAYALVAWGISLGPPALVAAAIGLISTALWAVIDDLKAWTKGEKSAFGDAMARWPKLEKLVYNVRDAVKFTKDQFIDLWNFLPKVGNAIREALGLDPIEYDEVQKDVVIKRTGAIPNKTYRDFFGFDPQLQNILFGPGSQVPGQDDNLRGQLPITNDVNASPVLQRTNTITVENINVDATGGDSKEIAENVGIAITEQLKNTVENFDSSMDK